MRKWSFIVTNNFFLYARYVSEWFGVKAPQISVFKLNSSGGAKLLSWRTLTIYDDERRLSTHAWSHTRNEGNTRDLLLLLLFLVMQQSYNIWTGADTSMLYWREWQTWVKCFSTILATRTTVAQQRGFSWFWSHSSYQWFITGWLVCSELLISGDQSHNRRYFVTRPPPLPPISNNKDATINLMSPHLYWPFICPMLETWPWSFSKGGNFLEWKLRKIY